MGLRINTNIAALTTSRILRRSTTALNKSLERLSSGLRINRAADDAAGLAIAEGLNAIRRGTKVAQRNAQDGISLIQTAEGALGETSAILQRMRELAVQAASGTLSLTNRTDLQAEVTQLLAQIDSIANFNKFNGISILNTVANITIQIGTEASQTLLVTTSDNTAVGLGVNGITIANVAGASAALTTLNTALNTLTSQRAAFGAQQNRLQFTINTLAIQEEQSAAAESSIRDADIATETILFTRNQILVSAGTAVLSQANIIPQTALQLLGG